jgi:hypothetical protein
MRNSRWAFRLPIRFFGRLAGPCSIHPRAPAGHHTLILDTFVSNWLADGRRWQDYGPEYVENVLLPKLRQYAPNITNDKILGRYVETRESFRGSEPLVR